jgi:hypothetical protein
MDVGPLNTLPSRDRLRERRRQSFRGPGGGDRRRGDRGRMGERARKGDRARGGDRGLMGDLAREGARLLYGDLDLRGLLNVGILVEEGIERRELIRLRKR